MKCILVMKYDGLIGPFYNFFSIIQENVSPKGLWGQKVVVSVEIL